MFSFWQGRLIKSFNRNNYDNNCSDYLFLNNIFNENNNGFGNEETNLKYYHFFI